MLDSKAKHQRGLINVGSVDKEVVKVAYFSWHMTNKHTYTHKIIMLSKMDILKTETALLKRSSYRGVLASTV